MTTEELLALPEDGIDRWLIEGRLREKPAALRDRWSARALVRVARFLDDWLDLQPEPRGLVLVGNVGVRLQRDPDTTVGIDIVYLSAEQAARLSDTPVIDGSPILAVEVLSPNDTQEEINDKIDLYLQAGVALVWIINPYHRTIELFRPGAEPQLVNVLQVLSGEPELPGFYVPVAQLFV
jgi:Uma2 family endonuclease